MIVWRNIKIVLLYERNVCVFFMYCYFGKVYDSIKQISSCQEGDGMCVGGILKRYKGFLGERSLFYNVNILGII